MKKRILAFVCAITILILAGCSGSGGGSGAAVADGEWKFERKIEIVCPWGAGGGADTTLRTFAASLEKEIGVPIVINNKTGAGGATGVDFASKQPADGYTWLLSTQSPLLAQLTGTTDVQVYESAVPVSRLVHDTNILVAGKDAPYNNLAELMDYIEANPGKVKAGCMTLTGLDGLVIRLVFGDTVEAVAYSEGAQLNADIMGGHMSLGVVGPAEVLGLVQSGDVKPIVVFSENRLTIPEYENTECTGELGYEAYFGPARGIYAPVGTPEAAIKAFDEAAAKAVATTEFQEWAAGQGLDQRPGYLNTADFTAWWEAEYEALKALLQ